MLLVYIHFTKQTIFVIKLLEAFYPFVCIKHDRGNHSAPFDATFAFIAAETLVRVIDVPCVEGDGFIELINILNNV